MDLFCNNTNHPGVDPVYRVAWGPRRVSWLVARRTGHSVGRGTSAGEWEKRAKLGCQLQLPSASHCIDH